MLDLLLTGPFVPFTLALALLVALVLLEAALLLAGGSLLGVGGDLDGPDLDGPDLDGPDLDAPDLDGPDGPEAGGPDAPDGPAAWLGLAGVPAMIWLAAALTGFGVAGLAIQSAAVAVAGPLPAPLAVPPAAAAGLLFARAFGRTLSRLVPRTETTAQTARQLSRRRGVVTQGTASRGRPAEVRVVDRHGNAHFLRAEPLSDGDVIAQGTEVLVVSPPREAGHRLVPLAD